MLNRILLREFWVVYISSDFGLFLFPPLPIFSLPHLFFSLSLSLSLHPEASHTHAPKNEHIRRQLKNDRSRYIVLAFINDDIFDCTEEFVNVKQYYTTHIFASHIGNVI